MFDVLKYKPVIEKVLRRFKVRKMDEEDMRQECYLALLERQRKLEISADDDGLAELICSGRLVDIRRKNNREVKTDSLDDPRYHGKSLKVPIPLLAVSDEKLMAGIESLPYEQYQVVYYMYIEGFTYAKTQKEVNRSVQQVRTIESRAIANLKTYFEDVL